MSCSHTYGHPPSWMVGVEFVSYYALFTYIALFAYVYVCMYKIYREFVVVVVIIMLHLHI